MKTKGNNRPMWRERKFMSLTAICNDIRLLAMDCDNRSLDYRCPGCGAKMILVKGVQKCDHFRHEKNSDCKWGAGETCFHLEAKQWLYKKLINHPSVEQVELECTRFDGIRPDIAFKCAQRPWIGIEFQHSNISDLEIMHRCRKYSENGVYVLWVVTQDVLEKVFGCELRNHKLNKEKRIPKYVRSFRILHNFVFGFTGSEIVACQYEPVFRFDDYSGSWNELKTILECKDFRVVHIEDLRRKRMDTEHGTLRDYHKPCLTIDDPIKEKDNFKFSSKQRWIPVEWIGG
jgi:hypothetical protein